MKHNNQVSISCDYVSSLLINYHLICTLDDLNEKSGNIVPQVERASYQNKTGIHPPMRPRESEEYPQKLYFSQYEGFAELISNKILEKVLDKSIPYTARRKDDKRILISYNTFKDRWFEYEHGKLFMDWYKDCLTEIKGKLEEKL
ncbi:MAG: hypothetical protein KKF44_06425 [Nanoarchaeota archaeon]|nr:hypothetical protein [Nanoarchaeota archaeon]